MIHKPPKHLDQAAAKKWKEVFPQLTDAEQGTLDALAAYASAWSRWQAAELQIASLGAVVKSPAGFAIQNPYVAIAKDAQRQLRQWGDVLGLHPKSRSARKQSEDEPNDPILKLIHRKAK